MSASVRPDKPLSVKGCSRSRPLVVIERRLGAWEDAAGSAMPRKSGTASTTDAEEGGLLLLVSRWPSRRSNSPTHSHPPSRSFRERVFVMIVPYREARQLLRRAEDQVPKG